MDTHTIYSEDLAVQFVLPAAKRVSQRFDACGVVNEVVLHNRHNFCVPEQRIPGRTTTWGLGLCGEFVTPGIACQAAPREQFPKFGVGLLTQREKGGEHNVWVPYECEPFEINVEKGDSEITFVQEAKPCMGYAAITKKHYRADGNRLILTVEVENVGEKTLPLSEYQHNFVAIDGIPIQEGYKLELPYVKNIDAFSDCFQKLDTREYCESSFIAKDGSLQWTKSMENRTWFCALDKEDVVAQDGYYWKLSYKNSPAAVSESLSFVPFKAVHWGIEHCACVELYFAQKLEAGEKTSWQRTWTFTD